MKCCPILAPASLLASGLFKVGEKGERNKGWEERPFNLTWTVRSSILAVLHLSWQESKCLLCLGSQLYGCFGAAFAEPLTLHHPSSVSASSPPHRASTCWYPMVLESSHLGQCFPTCFMLIHLPQCHPNPWELGTIPPIFSLFNWLLWMFWSQQPVFISSNDVRYQDLCPQTLEDKGSHFNIELAYELSVLQQEYCQRVCPSGEHPFNLSE